MAQVRLVDAQGADFGIDVGLVGSDDGPLVELVIVPHGQFVNPDAGELAFMLMPDPPVFEQLSMVGSDSATNGSVGVEFVSFEDEGDEAGVRGLVTQDEIDAAREEALALALARKQSAENEPKRGAAYFDERLGPLFGQAWHNGKRLA